MLNIDNSAKYIEGLENRLGRMESLLRLSGLVNEEDLGKTDLGTLEKRLADKTAAHNSGKASNRSSSAHPSNAASEATQETTPPQDTHSSPLVSVTSPGSDKSNKEQEEEVENLSDMMCSLVTNNCGETRYIGMILLDISVDHRLTISRVIIRLLNLLAQWHSLGQ